MKNIILGLSGLILAGCAINTTRTGIVSLRSGSTVYKNEWRLNPNNQKDTIRSAWRYMVAGRQEVVLTIEKDESQITMIPLETGNLQRLDSIVRSSCKIDSSKFYFTNDEFDKKQFHLKEEISYASINNVIYLEYQPFAQGVTIPFKFRPALKANGINHPYTVETGLNVAFAGGWKIKRNWARFIYITDRSGSIKPDTKKIYKKSVDFSLGFFGGPTMQTINADNTRNSYSGTRSILGINYGAMAVAGLNRFNLGFAVGLDSYFGSLEQNYIYNNHIWAGLVVSFDFFGAK